MSDAVSAPAFAKLNLALVVGPLRSDGKHEVLTVMQRVALADTITLERSRGVEVHGFGGDSIVASALGEIHRCTGEAFAATIEKRIPVASGLGGGSSDAATALALANRLLARPLAAADIHEVAAGLGSDVPFFLGDSPMIGSGDGSTLELLALPVEHTVLLAFPTGAVKASTGAVYRAFDERDGPAGFQGRAEALRDAIRSIVTVADLDRLPPNDLCSSPLTVRLRTLGAVRADVTGAGPVVYGLFREREAAAAAAAALGGLATTWVTEPRW